MKIRSIPDLQNFPAYRGKFIVDTFRGQIRVRSWPRKQSQITKDKNGNQLRWFGAARQMAKFAEPNQQALAIATAKGKGLYPGDLLMMGAAGTLFQTIVGEPVDYTKWQPRIEPVSFQGIRTTLAASQTWGTGAPVIAIWGLPEFQSTQFWTAGDPTHIVIPPNIQKVQLTCCIRYTGGNPTFMFASIQKDDTQALNLKFGHEGGSSRMTCLTGPIAVAQGETFRVRCSTNVAGTMLKEGEVFFALEVLEAT